MPKSRLPCLPERRGWPEHRPGHDDKVRGTHTACHYYREIAGSRLSRAMTAENRDRGERTSLPLRLVAREHAADGARPARKLASACAGAHVRLEPVFEPPVVGKARGLGIDARR